jgi:septal ring factor EnvC (AmiA/AmiB activator)
VQLTTQVAQLTAQLATTTADFVRVNDDNAVLTAQLATAADENAKQKAVIDDLTAKVAALTKATTH